MMNLYKKNLKVLVLEPPMQLPIFDKAKPNGSLGPAYLIGALRKSGIEVDYLDATVGLEGADLKNTFYRRRELENGNITYGMNNEELMEVIAKYDIVATSSIFTVQTRMHFEMARLIKTVSKKSNKKILAICGGVNARALREHFLSNGFDIIGLADGERTIVQIVEQFSSDTPDWNKVERIAYRENGKTIITSAPVRKSTKFIDVPLPAIDAFPLDVYQTLGGQNAGISISHSPGLKHAGIQTSRGCQDKCTFCHISLEKQETDLVGNMGFLRMFSKEKISEGVDNAVNLGIKRLYFEDDNLFFNKKRLYELASHLKRTGLKYSNVNGANLRFMVNKVGNRYETDHEFINMLSSFGLDDLMLPFETRSKEMMQKYATGKYDPDEMNPIGILNAVKKAGITARSNFLIGFRDETWESVLATKEFAKTLFQEGLDQAAFGIPVPYPGTLDFEAEMKKSDVKKDFHENLFQYTDHMHPRGLPLFHTKVHGEKLLGAVKSFWEELNEAKYVNVSSATNLDSSDTNLTPVADHRDAYN